MAGSRIPWGVIRLLEGRFSSFFWGAGHRHWVSWDRICYPFEEGGLGIWRVDSIQTAFSCKLWTIYCHNETLWGQHMRARYGGRGDYRLRLYDLPGWKRICVIHDFCENIQICPTLSLFGLLHQVQLLCSMHITLPGLLGQHFCCINTFGGNFKGWLFKFSFGNFIMVYFP